MLMNKSDKKLIFILLIIIGLIFLILYFSKTDKPKKALVYYKDELVLTIDLSQTGKKNYTVLGELGNVVIEQDDNKVRVVEENSPNHICSKQGFIKESYEVLICLPNKVVIKIDDNNDIDTIVK